MWFSPWPFSSDYTIYCESSWPLSVKLWAFHSVWPWRTSQMISHEKNILWTLKPFHLQNNWRSGWVGGDWISHWRWQDAKPHIWCSTGEFVTKRVWHPSEISIVLACYYSFAWPEPELIVPVQGWKIPWDLLTGAAAIIKTTTRWRYSTRARVYVYNCTSF